MISKTTRAQIAALAALLCTSLPLRRRIAGPPSRGPRARPTLSGFALATFLIPPESSSA
jgi:hypothetical protein